jgi:cytochrome c
MKPVSFYTALLWLFACTGAPAMAGTPATPPAFAACIACHSTDGGTGRGPTLLGVMGRKAGTLSGFRYSAAMRQAGLTWSESTLAAFLADPQRTVPGNVMPFTSGTLSDADIRSLTAYLTTLR